LVLKLQEGIMPQWQRWINRFQTRVLWGQFLHFAADGLALFLFIFGTLVLVVRLLLPGLWPEVLWVLAGVAPIAGLAWYWAKNRQQTQRETVAMLDKALAAGGLLMTLHERPDRDWSEELPKLERLWQRAIPAWYPRRFASHVSLPILFAIAVCFVPLREAQSTPITGKDVAQTTTQQLDEIKQALAEQELLDEEEEKELTEEVAKLTEETQGTPLTHENWETVDALREKMLQKIAQADSQASKELSAVQQLAESQGDPSSGNSLSESEQAALEEQAADAVEQMIKKAEAEEKAAEAGEDGEQGDSDSQSGSSKMSSSLKDKLRRLGKNAKGGKPKLPSDPQERQELLDELKEELERRREELEKLRSQCKKCNGQGEGEGECESDGFNEERGPDGDGKPGRGGLSRGRGDASMRYGDESDDSKNKFKDAILPPSELGEPGEEIVDIQFTAPEVKPAANAPRGAARNVDQATGTQAWQRKLSPRHRSVVKEYFNGK